MKRFIKHLLISFLLLFILDKTTYLLLNKTPDYLYDNRLKDVLDGQINKDLIVLGSSKGAGNIIASQIEKETGLESYNLSYVGSNVVFHRFILKTLLAHNKVPKKLLLTIDNPAQFIDNNKSKNTLNFRFEKLYPLSIYNEVNNELIDQNSRFFLSKYFLLARLSKAHINYGKEKPKLYSPLLDDGSMPYIKKKDIPNLDFIDKENDYNITLDSQYKLNAFIDIQNMCKANGITLYYVFSPTMYKFNIDFFERFVKLVEFENHIFTHDNTNPIYKKTSTYFDHSHLMIHAARIFTSEISEFIKSENQ